MRNLDLFWDTIIHHMSATPFLYLSQYSKSPVVAARPGDRIPAAMCSRCGFPGTHPSALACIDLLRARIAELEFKARAGSGGPPRTGE
jgi:hypothetical protein